MEFKKLSEVPVTTNSSNAYILVEEDGEIKRLLSTNLEVARVQADLSEEDPTQPSFVHGKEDFSGSGGGAGVITYTYSSGVFLNGIPVSAEEIEEAWNSGNVLRIIDGECSAVIDTIRFYMGSVARGVDLYYHTGDSRVTRSL